MSQAPSDAALVASIIREKKVIVCCGAGGVGKTTTAAALGLAAARAGRKVLVLTIDPARRLAEAMAIPEAAARPARVPRERLEEAAIAGAGELHAWMLNPQVVFDGMVRRLSPTPERAERILSNRLYRLISEMVAGMQEYTAAEGLFELATGGHYDLLVLDTPPSRNALEFLEAPGRLGRFLDHKILTFFLPQMTPRRGFWRRAGALINNVFGWVFGQAFTEELQNFIAAFSGMFAAIRLHTEGVKALLASRDAAFLLVTSPDQAALAETAFMRDKIVAMGLPFAGFILNRSYAFTDGFLPPETLALPEDAPPSARSALAKLIALAGEERLWAERDRGLLAELKARLPRGALAVAAPHVGDAIEDLRGLATLASSLTAGAATP